MQLRVLALAVALAFLPGRVGLALTTAPVVPVDEKSDLDTLRDVNKQSGPRKIAARALAKQLGPKVADELIDIGPKATTPPDLRVLLATLLADMRDPAVDKKTVAQLREGNAVEKVFFLRASANTTDAKLAKEICDRCVAFTGEKDEQVRCLAVEVLVQREWADAVPAIERMLRKETDPATIGVAVPG